MISVLISDLRCVTKRFATISTDVWSVPAGPKFQALPDGTLRRCQLYSQLTRCIHVVVLKRVAMDVLREIPKHDRLLSWSRHEGYLEPNGPPTNHHLPKRFQRARWRRECSQICRTTADMQSVINSEQALLQL